MGSRRGKTSPACKSLGSTQTSTPAASSAASKRRTKGLSSEAWLRKIFGLCVEVVSGMRASRRWHSNGGEEGKFRGEKQKSFTGRSYFFLLTKQSFEKTPDDHVLPRIFQKAKRFLAKLFKLSRQLFCQQWFCLGCFTFAKRQ